VMSNNAKAIDKTVALVEKKVKTFVGGLKWM
jgi:hypothetical protein